MLSSANEIEVRPFRPEDAAGVCALFEACDWGPWAFGRPIDPDAFVHNLHEVGVVGFLVAVHRSERIVGTLSYRLVSCQKAASPGALWSDDFVVHPSFRAGAVTGSLLASAAELCLTLGYRKLQTHVEIENQTSLRLYKRFGFKQTGPACVDESTPLENHVPGLTEYLREAAGAESSAVRPEEALTGLLHVLPAVGREAMQDDAERWQGAAVVRYAIRVPWNPEFECLVDLESDAVVAVTGGLLCVECFPGTDRRGPEPNSIRYDVVVTSRLRYGCQAKVTVRCDGWSEVVSSGQLAPGRHRFATTVPGVLEAGHRVVTVELDAEPAPCEGNDVPPRVVLPVRVPAGKQPRASRSARSRPEDAPSLDSGVLRVSVDPCTGSATLHDRGRDTTAVRELWPQVGPPFPGGFKSPRACAVSIRRAGDMMELEGPGNVWVENDPGLLRAVPEVAAAGGLIVRRRLSFADAHLLRVETSVERVAGTPVGGQPVALRTWPWFSGEAPVIVVPVPGGRLVAPVVYQRLPFSMHNYEGLRTGDLPVEPGVYPAPWSAFVQADHVAGSIWPDASEVRFGLHWMPSVIYELPPLAPDQSVDLPVSYLLHAPGGHEAVVRAWEDLGRPGDNEGSLPDRSPRKGVTSLPVALETKPISGEGRIRGLIRALGGSPREGELGVRVGAVEDSSARVEIGDSTLFDLAVPAAARPGAYGLALRWSEGGTSTDWRVPMIVADQAARVMLSPGRSDWRIDNGVLELRVAPAFDGTITSLRSAGRQWLLSSFPRRRPMVGIPAAGGGAKAVAFDDDDPWLRSNTAERVPWSYAVETVEANAAGVTWRGLAMTAEAGDGDWAEVEARVLILLAPGIPVVLAAAIYRNTASSTRRFGAGFSVHPADGAGGGLWYMRDGEGQTLPSGERPGAREVARGEGVAGVCSAAGHIALACTPNVPIVGARRQGRWHVLARQPVDLQGGSAALVPFLLSVGPAFDPVWLEALPELARSVQHELKDLSNPIQAPIPPQLPAGRGAGTCEMPSVV